MIRINLLPVREARKRESGKQQLLIAVVLVIIEVGAFFYWSSTVDDELNGIVSKNNTLQQQVAESNKRSAEIERMKQEKEDLERQKHVLDSLVEGQTGPVRMLDELSLILTVVEDPALKLAQKKRGWNPDWDPRRLWIDTFVEHNRGVKVTGHARSNDDLAEFLHRLNTAKHFTDVRLNVSEAAEYQGTKGVRFDLDMLVLYGPADLKRLAEDDLGPNAKAKKQQ
jgi:type IV pilus assembly protein PilN